MVSGAVVGIAVVEIATELVVLGVIMAEVLEVLDVTGILEKVLVVIGILEEVLEVLVVTEELEVLVGTGVLEVLETEDEEDEDVTEAAGQSPSTDGTASGPVPISTRVVPQFAALASSKFWLSWS